MTNELSPVINSWWLKNIYYCRVFIFIPKHKFLFYFFPFKPLISPEWESTCPSHWSSTQKKKSMTLIDIIIFFFFFRDNHWNHKQALHVFHSSHLERKNRKTILSNVSIYDKRGGKKKKNGKRGSNSLSSIIEYLNYNSIQFQTMWKNIPFEMCHSLLIYNQIAQTLAIICYLSLKNTFLQKKDQLPKYS